MDLSETEPPSAKHESDVDNLATQTTIVVGASRGLGRGITVAFAEAGAPVIAVSRKAINFSAQSAATAIRSEIADAGDETVAATLLDRHKPKIVIIVAEAVPKLRPLQEHTWETFSVPWQTDVRIVFHWLREILHKPLQPGGRVVVVSNAAALGGSPLSGGYAGAKTTQRFMTVYAQDEARRANLDLAFTAVLPVFGSTMGVGRPAVQLYAARAAHSVDEYLQSFRQISGPPITPEFAGGELVKLVRTDAAAIAPGYLLTGSGLMALR